uniref:Uncharacterized protein n=1 Tax=Arundo donax TaxID=35708 RepID=A0A0A9I1V9_ARUDO
MSSSIIRSTCLLASKKKSQAQAYKPTDITRCPQSSILTAQHQIRSNNQVVDEHSHDRAEVEGLDEQQVEDVGKPERHTPWSCTTAVAWHPLPPPARTIAFNTLAADIVDDAEQRKGVESGGGRARDRCARRRGIR